MKQYLRFSKSVVFILTLVSFIIVLSPNDHPAYANDGGANLGSTMTQQAVNYPDVPTNQIIIKYKPSANLAGSHAPSGATRMQELSNAAGVHLTYFREMSGQAHVLRLDTRMDPAQVRQISDRLMALSDVDYAEPDAIMQPTLTPNDPQYGNQWDYFETYGINAQAAWDITTGSNNIVIGVVDTGITNHVDLSGRTLPGYDMIADTLVANDGDGRDSDPSDPGDWITPAESASGYFAGCPVTNSTWHGTHVAGTIGAASNNSVGVAGINWVSKIVPVRVLGKCGGYISDIADGMSWAAGLSVTGTPANANPAKVINVSIGGAGTCGTTYQNAINAITAAGTTVIVAAGNNNADASGFRPANCNGVITVAATDRSGNRAYYSNYGSIVEISAPGGDTYTYGSTNGILSTLNTGTTTPASDTYAYYQGTSMATPHVVGVASLLLSLSPTLTPAQVLQILQNTVSPFPGGSTCNTSICGSGMLNAGAAVGAMPRINSFSPSSQAAGGGSFTLTVYGANFANDSNVLWNGASRSTTWISSGELHATILGSDIGSPTTAQVSVVGTHVTYGSITTAGRAYSVTGVLNNLYLPLILKSTPLPGVPTLNAISNPSNSNAYNVTWTTSANASTYILQESFNDGSFTSPVEVYNGASTTWPASGKTAGTYYYRVKAHNTAGDSGWSGTQSTTVNPAAAWTTIVSTDFEGTFPSPWTVFDNDGTTNGEYYWGKRNCRVYSGSYSGWAIGAGANGSGLSCGATYPNNANSWMMYGPFSLSNTSAADLQFMLWLNSESSYDRVCRMASTDGINFSGTCTSGNTGGWSARTLDLANVYSLGNLLGQPNVWIALTFTSDSTINYAEGAYVDNIVLRKCPTGGTCPAGSPIIAPNRSHVIESPVQMNRPK